MDNRIMSIVLALLLVVSAVSAVSVTGPSFASMNQCDSLKQKFTLCSDVLGTYNISVEGIQKNWINVAPFVVLIDSNSCADFYAFITPECYANSGSYDFNILISGAESKKLSYSLTVTQAHNFFFNVTPMYQSSKPCEASDYNITVRNTGKFVDEFVLVQKGLIDSWVSYPQTKFVINPYSSFSGLLRVTTPCNVDANSYAFNIELYNTRTNSSGKISLIKSVTKFTPFIIDNLSEVNKFKVNSCEEFDKNISFGVKNNSNLNDELTFDVIDENYVPVGKDVAYFEPSKVKLDFNSASNAFLMVKKRTVSDSNLMIRVNSKAYSKNYFYPIELVIKNCYDLNVVQKLSAADLNKAQISSCASFVDSVVNFNNNGSEVLDFNAVVYLDSVLTETKHITVGPNSSVSEVFKITAPKVPSTPSVSIKVSAPFLEKVLDYKVSFENCFDAGLDVQNILVCKNGYLSQKFTVRNTGSMKGNFKARIDSNWITLSSTQFDLNSGESKELTFLGNVPLSYAQEQTIVLESLSTNTSKTVPVITLTNEECNDLNSSMIKVVDANCCEGEIVPLTVRNNGYFAQSIGINSIKPEWISVTDSNLFLLPKTEKTIYLNIAPKAKDKGDFNAQIYFISDKNIQREINFLVHVLGDTCVVPEGFNEDTNSKVTDLNGIKVTEVKVDFVISNDSNENFTVTNISLGDVNSVVKFDSNRVLKPTESMTASIVAWFSGSAPMDKNVSVVIETSKGPITKTQLISFAGKDQSLSITGWFGAYTAPLLGILLFAIFVVIVVVLFGSSKKKKNGFKW